jgi:hypothetical protein
VLLNQDQQRELAEALRRPPEEGGMRNSPKVGEWVEAKVGKAVSNKKQRRWAYLKSLGHSPKAVPRFHHAKAAKWEQGAFEKGS